MTKRMTLYALPMAVFIVLYASVSWGGYCRQLEYAEVKDMSTKDLITTFCRHEALAEAYAKEDKEWAKLEKEHGRRVEAQVYRSNNAASWKECVETSAKILTALKKRAVAKPECDMQTGKSKTPIP